MLWGLDCFTRNGDNLYGQLLQSYINPVSTVMSFLKFDILFICHSEEKWRRDVCQSVSFRITKVDPLFSNVSLTDNTNSVIIYSLSCHFKDVRLTFVSRMIFWKMLVPEQWRYPLTSMGQCVNGYRQCSVRNILWNIFFCVRRWKKSYRFKMIRMWVIFFFFSVNCPFKFPSFLL